MCGSKAAGTNVDNGVNKRIMLVSEFYYGQFEGDGSKMIKKTNTTFKCQSCLKVLKNNIRYDHILELSYIQYVYSIYSIHSVYNYTNIIY